MAEDKLPYRVYKDGECVLAAEKAGMSYGKYAALVREGLISCPWPEDRPRDSAETGPEQVREDRWCEVCGKTLREDAQWNQKTCSRECSAELNRRRNFSRYQENVKFKPREKIQCLKCGELFLPNRKSQKFCGRVCQDNYNRAKARARRNGGVISDMAHRNYGPGKCLVCGAEYIKRSWCQQVCSRKCGYKRDDMKRRKGLC